MAARQRQPLRFRQGVFRIHQFLGALVGGYWILMAATGAVLLYGEELERLLHPRWFALDTRGTTLPVSRLLEPVAARFPETPVEDIRLPRRAGDSVLFLLPDPNGGSTREVFVDPRSAAILGHRLESESWLLQVYRLHAELLLRDTGASVNGILALAASALLASSIPIWMPRNRSQWKQRFTVNIKSSRMRSLFDLHNVFGIAALPVLTTVVLTGIFFVYASRLEPVVHAVAGSSPAPEHAEPSARGNRLPVDQLRAIAESAVGGARTTWINLPLADGKPFRITRAYAGAEGIGHTAEISVDPVDGRILGITTARGEPLGRRVVRWVYPLHTGSWGGAVSKLVYGAGAIAPIVLMITGIAKWRLRNRQKSERKQARSGATGNAAPSGDSPGS